jgi:protein-tyrosine-phosphatase
MAEAIASAHCGNSKELLFIGSAGVATMNGCPPTEETLVALNGIGISHEGQSTVLTANMVRKAALVLCMTPSHVAAVERLIGANDPAARQIHLLDPHGEAIPDPIGMGQPTYDALAKEFVEIIPRRLETLLGTI